MYIQAIENTPECTPYIIHQAPHQKIIQIHRPKGINFKSNYAAMQNLSQAAYILYMYLLMKGTHRVWPLYSQEIYDHTPIKKRAYLDAVKELQDKHYLVPGSIDLGTGKHHNTNTFHLYETPHN